MPFYTTSPDEQRFEQLKFLGEGAFATVTLAKDRKHDRNVAIKRVTLPEDEKTVQRLQREVQVLERVKHSSIVQMYEFDDSQPGFLYVIMEVVVGGTLEDLLCKRGAMDEMTSATFARQILSALEYIHGKGIVHRDIKPDNIMSAEPLPPRGESLESVKWKLIDFGLARRELYRSLKEGGKRSLSRSRGSSRRRRDPKSPKSRGTPASGASKPAAALPPSVPDRALSAVLPSAPTTTAAPSVASDEFGSETRLGSSLSSVAELGEPTELGAAGSGAAGSGAAGSGAACGGSAPPPLAHAVGSAVMVTRSSGLESLATVTGYDSVKQVYSLELGGRGSGQFKQASEAMMRAATASELAAAPAETPLSPAVPGASNAKAEDDPPPTPPASPPDAEALQASAAEPPAPDEPTAAPGFTPVTAPAAASAATPAASGATAEAEPTPSVDEGEAERVRAETEAIVQRAAAAERAAAKEQEARRKQKLRELRHVQREFVRFLEEDRDALTEELEQLQQQTPPTTTPEGTDAADA